MKVCVLGLWHLGSVTAACLAAAGHDVVGLDPTPATVAACARAGRRCREPGLDELVARGLAAGALRFTTDAAAAVADADVVWVTFDTPVDDDDRADVEFVVDAASRRVSASRGRRGRARLVAAAGRHDRAARASVCAVAGRRACRFACSPENLRLGKAIDVFTQSRPRRRRRARRRAIARRVDRAARAVHRPHRVDVGRVGRDDQARDQRVPGDLGHVHQRDRGAVRAGRRRREGSRARPEDRARASARRRTSRPARRSPAARWRATSRSCARLGRTHRSADAAARRRRGRATTRTSSGRAPADAAARRASRARRVAVWGLTYKPGTDTLRRSARSSCAAGCSSSGAARRACTIRRCASCRRTSPASIALPRRRRRARPAPTRWSSRPSGRSIATVDRATSLATR